MRAICRVLIVLLPFTLTACHYMQDYVPPSHRFCSSTKTPGWKEATLEHETQNTHYRISLDINPLYQYEDEVSQFAPFMEAHHDWTTVRISGKGKNKLTEPDVDVWVGEGGSLAILYDARQAVLEVDGKSYSAISGPLVSVKDAQGPWKYEEVKEPLEIKSNKDFYLRFPVQVGEHSKVKLKTGTAEIDGQQLAMPVVDFSYCPDGGHYQPMHWQ